MVLKLRNYVCYQYMLRFCSFVHDLFHPEHKERQIAGATLINHSLKTKRCCLSGLSIL